MPQKKADKYTKKLQEQVEEDFLKYQSAELYQVVHSWMKRQTFGAGETVTYRVLHHWEEKKLLPDGVPISGGSWRRFTPVEAAWLKVINHLREFGVPLDKIAVTKTYVMRWDSKTYSYPLFEFHLFSAVFTGYDPYVVLFSDGSALLANSVQIEAMKMVDAGNDMLLVSLKSIADGIKLPFTKPVKLHSLSDAENEFIVQARDNKNKEITARKKKGVISEIETTAVFPDMAGFLQEKDGLKTSQEYAEVTTKFEEGKAQSFQVKKKKIL